MSTENNSGYEAFYDRFVPTLMRYARSRGMGNDAEDFAHDVLLKAWQQWERLLQHMPPEEQARWMTTAMVRKGIDFYRRRDTRRRAGDVVSLEDHQERNGDRHIKAAEPDIAERVVEADTIKRLAAQIDQTITDEQKAAIRRTKKRKRLGERSNGTDRGLFFRARSRAKKIIRNDS